MRPSGDADWVPHREYVELLLLTAIVAAAAIPLYYYRSRIVSWFQLRA